MNSLVYPEHTSIHMWLEHFAIFFSQLHIESMLSWFRPAQPHTTRLNVSFFFVCFAISGRRVTTGTQRRTLTVHTSTGRPLPYCKFGFLSRILLTNLHRFRSEIPHSLLSLSGWKFCNALHVCEEFAWVFHFHILFLFTHAIMRKRLPALKNISIGWEMIKLT